MSKSSVLKYGTSEGAKLGWDARGRGRKEEVKSAKLSPTDKAFVEDYTHSGYAKTNYDLRSPGKAFRTEEDKIKVSNTIKSLDKAIDQSTLKEDLTVYRGMGDKFVADNFDHLIGATIEDKGFVSTSTNIEIAKPFAGVGKISTKSSHRIVARISLPKGSKALSISDIVPDNSYEEEFILPRGSKFKVTGTEKTKHEWYVDMKAI